MSADDPEFLDHGGKTYDAAVLHHQVEVLGEPLDDAVALREAGAPLEPQLEPRLVEGPHAVRDPVVLFDERRTDARLVGDELQERRELGIVVDEAHVLRASSMHSSMSEAIAFVP